MSDAVDSKSFLDNLLRNNTECTGLFICISISGFFVLFCFVFFFLCVCVCVCVTCILKHTQLKFKLSVFPFGNESQIPLIECSKTRYKTASLVGAISKKLQKFSLKHIQL